MLLATTFGLGYMRPASGTWGSMPPVVMAGLLWLAGFGPQEAPIIYHGALAVVFVVFCAACVFGGDEAERKWGKDPSNVVADETAGQCIALIALPLAGFWESTATLALAFVAFRIFDILKLWPADGLQKIRGGWGILLDDLVAGIQALIVVQLIVRLAVPMLF